MGKSDKYILNSKEPVPVNDLLAWARWFETANTNVAFDIIEEGVEISTVFIGLDHNYRRYMDSERDGYKPHIFETMVIGGEYDYYVERYSTWDEDVKGHHRIVAMCFEVDIDKNEQ